MAQNLTHGSIASWVLRLAWPTMLLFVLQISYSLADLFFLGKLGEKVLAAFAISFNTFFLVLALAMTLGAGSLSQIASFYGAGNLAGIRRVFPQTVMLAMVLGAIGWLLAVLSSAWYFDFFTADPVVRDLGISFYRIYSSSLLWQVFLFSMSHCWRAVGDFKTPMKLVGLSVLVNLLLDPLFIFGYGTFEGWGMNGAAWATMLSQMLGGSVYLWLMLKPTKISQASPLKLQFPLLLDWQQIRRTLTIGLPVGMQYLFFAIGSAALYFMLRPLGAAVVASAGVGLRIFEASILPIISIGAAVSSMVGQNKGAGKLPRVWASLRWGLLYSFLLVLVLSVFIFSTADSLVGLFTDSPQVLLFGTAYAMIHVLALPFFAVIFNINAVAVGIGRTDLSLGIEITRMVTILLWLVISYQYWGSNFLAIFWSHNIASIVQVGFSGWVLYYLWRGPLKISLPKTQLETQPKT